MKIEIEIIKEQMNDGTIYFVTYANKRLDNYFLKIEDAVKRVELLEDAFKLFKRLPIFIEQIKN